MIICRICLNEKAKEEYYKYPSGKSFTKCKSCCKTTKKITRTEPRRKVTEQERNAKILERIRLTAPEVVVKSRTIKDAQYNREQDIRKKILYRTKVRARAINVPCSLLYTDIVVPMYCPVLGIKLEVSANGPKDNSPSIDRIVPILGYIPGNIQIISNKANRMKSNANPEELVKFANWILKTFTKDRDK